MIIFLQRQETKYQKANFPNIQKDPDPESDLGLMLENNPRPRKHKVRSLCAVLNHQQIVTINAF